MLGKCTENSSGGSHVRSAGWRQHFAQRRAWLQGAATIGCCWRVVEPKSCCMTSPGSLLSACDAGPSSATAWNEKVRRATRRVVGGRTHIKKRVHPHSPSGNRRVLQAFLRQAEAPGSRCRLCTPVRGGVPRAQVGRVRRTGLGCCGRAALEPALRVPAPKCTSGRSSGSGLRAVAKCAPRLCSRSGGSWAGPLQLSLRDASPPRAGRTIDRWPHVRTEADSPYEPECDSVKRSLLYF